MWKTINVFDNRYAINENGEVINKLTGHYLSPYILKNGYKMVDLHFNGKRKRCYIHRLIADTFIPNPNNFPVVMHLDNNKLNCSISNLKWGTYSENNAQAIADGINTLSKPDNRKYYDLYGNVISFRVHGIKEAMRLSGITNDNTLRSHISRKTKIGKGEYKDFKIKLSDNQN